MGTRAVVNAATFDTPDWAVVDNLPDNRTGKGAFVIDNRELGDCEADDESGILYLQSPPVALPADIATLRLAFEHWFATEARWDGGNLKMRINGGIWQQLPSSLFLHNPYNTSLYTFQFGSTNTNPMAGESAFTGFDEGSVRGSWGQSQLELSNVVAAGDTVEFRFEMGLDGCNGVHGWYIDDVELVQCQPPTGCDPG